MQDKIRRTGGRPSPRCSGAISKPAGHPAQAGRDYQADRASEKEQLRSVLGHDRC
jgi:hypothetical protein